MKKATLLQKIVITAVLAGFIYGVSYVAGKGFKASQKD